MKIVSRGRMVSNRDYPEPDAGPEVDSKREWDIIWIIAKRGSGRVSARTVVERRGHRLEASSAGQLRKPPGSGSLKSRGRRTQKTREYGTTGRPVIASRVCGRLCRKLGWNHVGDARAPRARVFACCMEEVIEMTKDETDTLAHGNLLLDRSPIREEQNV